MPLVLIIDLWLLQLAIRRLIWIRLVVGATLAWEGVGHYRQYAVLEGEDRAKVKEERERTLPNELLRALESNRDDLRHLGIDV